mgnify:CR=1 FL=1
MMFPLNHGVMAAGGGGGADPLPITSGLFIHYNSREEDYPNEADITTWTDRSGNGRDAVSGSSIGSFGNPQMMTSGINGRKSVRFLRGSSSSDRRFFKIPNHLTALDSSGGEMFLVLQGDHDPGASFSKSGAFTFGDTGANTVHWPYTDGRLFQNWGTSSRELVGDSDDFGNTLINPHIINCRSFPSDFSCQVHQSGGLLIDYSDAVNTPSFSADSFLGLSYLPSVYGFDGLMGEFIVYNRDLTPEERSDVLDYLHQSWGLT